MNLFSKRKSAPSVTQEQFDSAAKALSEFLTGTPARDDFLSIENDRFWVLARIVLEGAGIEVPQ